MRQQLASETEERITNLSKKFEELLVLTPSEKELGAACAVNCANATPQIRDQSRRDGANREAAMDYVISQIHGEVDAYLARAVDPNHFDGKSVEQGLKQVLAHAFYDNPPSAFVLNSEKGPSLIVVYALGKGTLMGQGGTSVTLRAYNAAQGRFKLADLTGDNLDGYGDVSVKKLHSPVPDEMWMLVWGHMTGANGPNIRMRVYAYGGKKFRTMWMPENSWGGFTVHVTDHSFTVDGGYYREDGVRHDAYFLAPDGLYRAVPDVLK